MVSLRHYTELLIARKLDLSAAREFSVSLFGQHVIEVQRPSSFKMEYFGHSLKGSSITLGYVRHGTDISVAVNSGDIKDIYNISLPIAGHQELRTVHGRTLSQPDQAILIMPELETELDMSGDCQKIHITIARRAVERVLSDLLRRPIDSLIVFKDGMDAAQGSTGAWWRMARNFLSEFQATSQLNEHYHFSDEVENILIRCLLLSQPSNYSGEIENLFIARTPAYVTRARNFIEANYFHPIHLHDIEFAAGVTRQRLFKDFCRHTGFTPIAYLKNFRLRRAHEQILKAGQAENISTIALSVGFTHLGRFSRDYKQMYGKSPSETALQQEAS